MEWLWTPHRVTWQPRRDDRRRGAANDGSEDAAYPYATEIPVFIEPKDSQWAAERGVMTESQPHLVIGYPDDMRSIVTGDVLEWGDRRLRVENRPILHEYDDYPSAELIATDQTTGGRRDA